MTTSYHVYGVGNALVDIEVETTAEQLSELGVEKGLMTLVEPHRQQELIASLGGRQHKRSGGGSAANTITALSHLGGDAYYSCRIADDDTGHFFATSMSDAGVNTNVHTDKGTDLPTGTCLVMVTPDADRTMNTSLGISATLTPDQVVEDELSKSRMLYIEGYLVSTPTSLRTALRARKLAKEHGVQTAFTFSDPAMVHYCKEGLEHVLGDGVDVLLCNEEEATVYTGTDDVAAAGEVLRQKAGIVVITCGADGARIWDGEHWITVPAHPVTPIDTNGAGDLYAGAFLYGLTQGHGCEAAGRLASLASGILVTRFGARLPREDLAAVKRLILGE
jgi:fructokinase